MVTIKTDIVNEWEYDNIIDNYRESCHGIKVCRFEDVDFLVKEQKKELEKYCYCKSGEGTFFSKNKDERGVCAFCFVKEKLFGDD